MLSTRSSTGLCSPFAFTHSIQVRRGNFAGFVVAVSFSFFANAGFTFKSSTTTLRYMLYVGFMGTLSAAVGWCADKSGMAPIVTLILFSAISLVCGFIYSKFIVFRDAK